MFTLPLSQPESDMPDCRSDILIYYLEQHRMERRKGKVDGSRGLQGVKQGKVNQKEKDK